MDIEGHRHRKTTILRLVALAICVLVGPVLAAPPDAWITAKTKLALLTTEGVHATDVNVDTVNGQVTLHGKVQSAEEKDKAQAVAKNIAGVQGVRNLLQVVPPERQKAVQQSDDQIKVAVEKALQRDALLNDSSITVQSVNQGVVLLAGTAKSVLSHLSAVEDAASVPGVRQVNSEIQSPNTLADETIWHDYTSKAGNEARGMSDAARDMWITSATKMRLLADRETPALDINVDTRKGIVTLFGMVPSQQAKASAEAEARKVSGVQRVQNELQVVPNTQQKAVKIRDDILQTELKKTFENRDDFKDVSVEVKNCVARLTGTVPNEMQRLEAAVVARSTDGVCSVKDDLRIAD